MSWLDAVDQETAGTPFEHERPLSLELGARLVISAVAWKCGTNLQMVLGRGRKRSLSNARIRCYAAVRRMGLSYLEIGEIFNRDHSSVMSGCKRALEIEAREFELHKCRSPLTGADSGKEIFVK